MSVDKCILFTLPLLAANSVYTLIFVMLIIVKCLKIMNSCYIYKYYFGLTKISVYNEFTASSNNVFCYCGGSNK